MKGYRTVVFMSIAFSLPMLQMVLEIAQIPEWKDMISPDVWPMYSMGVTVMGIWLRFVTTSAVGGRNE